MIYNWRIFATNSKSCDKRSAVVRHNAKFMRLCDRCDVIKLRGKSLGTDMLIHPPLKFFQGGVVLGRPCFQEGFFTRGPISGGLVLCEGFFSGGPFPGGRFLGSAFSQVLF